jgi:small conductance mechanosensitive channel
MGAMWWCCCWNAASRLPRLEVRPNTHTDNYWQVYFETNRMIVDLLGSNGFPNPSAN